MRFNLTLVPKSKKEVAPINYQYPLSAVISMEFSIVGRDYVVFLYERRRLRVSKTKGFKQISYYNETIFKIV